MKSATWHRVGQQRATHSVAIDPEVRVQSTYSHLPPHDLSRNTYFFLRASIDIDSDYSRTPSEPLIFLTFDGRDDRSSPRGTVSIFNIELSFLAHSTNFLLYPYPFFPSVGNYIKGLPSNSPAIDNIPSGSSESIVFDRQFHTKTHPGRPSTTDAIDQVSNSDETIIFSSTKQIGQ